MDGGIRIGVYAWRLSRFIGAAYASESKKLNRVAGAWPFYQLPVHRFSPMNPSLIFRKIHE